MKTSVIKIISGGQTGVDRAALDFAIRHSFPHGGWCPRGRLAEDGFIPPIYRLRETELPEYEERTEKNVLDSDATLIVARNKELSGGTAFTKACAEKHDRPVLVICESDGVSKTVAVLTEFIRRNKVRTLNVAGPRQSQAPGIREFVEQLLVAALVSTNSPT
ncbi:MAG TPA: putative molybdenum carrier protein [Verrucomicrobiae bacterium]|nr:putative molybdenum carrier protein [Verrucomicrobiae bacterium]